MKVGIIGAGAMGSLFASHLADGGADVRAFDQWREHIEAIRERGLIVKHSGSERTIRINATTDANAAGPCDTVLVMVKYHQTVSAVRAAAPMIGPQTTIITLQNGLGNVGATVTACPGQSRCVRTHDLNLRNAWSRQYRGKLEPRRDLPLARRSPAERRAQTFCALLNAGGIDAWEARPTSNCASGRSLSSIAA